MFNKATDVQRDSYYFDDTGTVKVMGIVDDHVVYERDDKRVCVIQWEFFINGFSLLRESDWPVRYCKCGCGYIISRHSSRKKIFKSPLHRARLAKRIKDGEENTRL